MQRRGFIGSCLAAVAAPVALFAGKRAEAVEQFPIATLKNGTFKHEIRCCPQEIKYVKNIGFDYETGYLHVEYGYMIGTPINPEEN